MRNNQGIRKKYDFLKLTRKSLITDKVWDQCCDQWNDSFWINISCKQLNNRKRLET